MKSVILISTLILLACEGSSSKNKAGFTAGTSTGTALTTGVSAAANAQVVGSGVTPIVVGSSVEGSALKPQPLTSGSPVLVQNTQTATGTATLTSQPTSSQANQPVALTPQPLPTPPPPALNVTTDGDLAVNSWFCKASWDPLSHYVKLSNFNPNSPSGFRLHMRPGPYHCAGIILAITVANTRTGAQQFIPCRNPNACTGVNGFAVGVGSHNSWDIAPGDFAQAAVGAQVGDKFVARFDFVDVFANGCAGDGRASYHLAVALMEGPLGPPPPSGAGDCGAVPFDFSAGFSGYSGFGFPF